MKEMCTMIDFKMYRSAFEVTSVCNLRCKYCVAYNPYSSEHKHFSVSYLRETALRYFTIVSHVGTLL